MKGQLAYYWCRIRLHRFHRKTHRMGYQLTCERCGKEFIEYFHY